MYWLFNTKKGLYLLAYKRLLLDVEHRQLIPDKDITVCKEYTLNGYKQSIRKFLDADDYDLLENFEKNQEIIKDKLMLAQSEAVFVNDMPYIIELGMDYTVDLKKEYDSILKMYKENEVTYPIKAFFGELIKRPNRKREIPITLINNRINLDQLLAINTAMKYPVAYIQGPPGTGKTSTIVNTIITAFFNDKTVLLTSYNNHPVDGVVDMLTSLKYGNKKIPFPVIRLGNFDKMKESLLYIERLIAEISKIQIFETTLNRNKDEKVYNTKKLTELLKRYDELLDLKERKETIEKLLEKNTSFEFQVELQTKQLYEINKKINEVGEITTEDALKLLNDDEVEFRKYLYYTSSRFIKRIFEPKNADIIEILNCTDETERVLEFSKFLSIDENLKRFMRIFPIIAITNSSAYKLGTSKPHFDITIMDEASQCNIAISLIPIIRGKSLMLVGDPQQLNPVVVMDPVVNLNLRNKYNITDEYDYINNSIYKAYLANDSVSDEILLSHHYRCHKKIIEFNNKKYYNNKLIIKSENNSNKPLVFVDIKENTTNYKNTAPSEAEMIIKYAIMNKDTKIGVITPFVNQKELINNMIKQKGLENITCGTVHAFQGDEKDVIMFSLAITDKTHQNTYNWLKNNKELINVATSRAKDKLILLSSNKQLNRLNTENDDIFELVEYIKNNGETNVTPKEFHSRALGIKPYSTEIEEDFLKSLNHAISNILLNGIKCVVHKEVPISQVFECNETYDNLFYTGRFDFVVYEKTIDKREIPIFAIELDGKEHIENQIVAERDKIKNNICKQHGFILIRIENSYARRYNYIKDILIDYFTNISKIN